MKNNNFDENDKNGTLVPTIADGPGIKPIE